MKVFNVKLPLFKEIVTFQINNNPLLFYITIFSITARYNCVRNRMFGHPLKEVNFQIKNRGKSKVNKPLKNISTHLEHHNGTSRLFFQIVENDIW